MQFETKRIEQKGYTVGRQKKLVNEHGWEIESQLQVLTLDRTDQRASC